MLPVCLYFQVHQPYRLRRDYSFFDIGADHRYDDEALNRDVVQRVAERCYLPANEIILNLIRKYDGRFRVAFAITGTALEQFRMYAPEVVSSFRKLVRSGCVELLGETYYHSLAFRFSQEEYHQQIKMHRRIMGELFEYEPTTLRNTELIYNNDLAQEAADLGYRAILGEGANQVLGWRTPDHVYRPVNNHSLALLLRNYRLSDDIAFRFARTPTDANADPAEAWARRVRARADAADVVNLFMDYETFGEHYDRTTGILDFLQGLPEALLRDNACAFHTPAEIAAEQSARTDLDVPFSISWADMEKDLTAWIGNPMQDAALEDLYGMRADVLDAGDGQLFRDWRRLQSSDHFYYMCTKWASDGQVHRHFNPFATPHDAYLVFTHVLNDIRYRLHAI